MYAIVDFIEKKLVETEHGFPHLFPDLEQAEGYIRNQVADGGGCLEAIEVSDSVGDDNPDYTFVDFTDWTGRYPSLPHAADYREQQTQRPLDGNFHLADIARDREVAAS